MKMTFRWFGEGNDPISLQDIKQIPGMKGIVTSLHHTTVGEVWKYDEIIAVKNNVEKHGLDLDVIESVNIHEDIKLGVPSRDMYIDNYIKTLEQLSRAGIKTVCYNFMPVFDWTRSDLAKKLQDGSTALSYDEKAVLKMNPVNMFENIAGDKDIPELPGWEVSRLKDKLKPLFEQYSDIDNEKLWKNLEYFLKAVIPAAEKLDVKMAIHPDDPPWNIFGLPRIITGFDNLNRMMKLVDNPYNGITLCTGSLGANPQNDLPAAIRHFGKMGRIHFAHVRNVKHTGERVFHEAPHITSEGSIDIYEVIKAFSDISYAGPIRPDHGRMIWGETGRPGYGLYDRALGSTYLNGLWEGITKTKC
ncbi:MAG: mannonate dehydratase [Spirochaetes bacterium]|nr:mannonate dehydratase [Spirochaetota bacterium]